MIEYSGEITSLEDLSSFTQTAVLKGTILSGCVQYYRGHGCSNYKLLSNISRHSSYIRHLQSTEEKIISDLKERIEKSSKKDYFHVPNYSNCLDQNWYWLTQAQHLGIPTRLLDWTLSIEIALYFAVSDNCCKNQDGDLWVFFVPDALNINNITDKISLIKPFQYDRDLFINIPIHWNMNFEKNEPQRNILSQQGKFFIRSYANSLKPLETEPFYQKYLLRYKVPSKSKSSLLEELNSLNYTSKTIYKTVDETMKTLKEELLEEYNLRTKKCSS